MVVCEVVSMERVKVLQLEMLRVARMALNMVEVSEDCLDYKTVV